MAPPAKRRKRDNADDDDSEDDPIQNRNTLMRFLSASPNKTRSPDKPTTKNAAAASRNSPLPSPSPVRKRTTRATAAASTTRSPSTSPLKSRTRGGAQRKRKAAAEAAGTEGGEEEKGGRSANLLTLFSRQAQRSQQLHDPISESNNNGVAALEDEDEDDVPLMLSSASAAASTLVGRAKAAQKRFATSSGAGNGFGVGVGGPQRNGYLGVQAAAGAGATGGQKFLRPAKANASKAGSTMANDGDDARPWSERFAPVSLDELAVHKRKVQDVRRWLDEVFSGRTRQRLLVLKGAAGSGKTTTLRLLARDMRCEVLEWRNPANSFGVAGHGYQSAAAQFEEFLGRGGKFGQLDVESDGATPPPMLPPPPSSATGNEVGKGAGRRLILVEEFPNTFMRSSSGLVGFRNAILQFLAANTPALAGFGFSYNSDPVTPIVMVISETLLTTTSASADSFTAHRLLGPEILRHPGTGVIEFNPVAPTFLTKALELVVQKEARKSGRRRTPGPLVLQRLGEIGDIRNAISSLEFLCVKGDDEADWGSKVAFTKPKRGAKGVPALTKGEQDSLELVSQREATLGIFHAVGKVVYNKRGSEFPPGSVEAAAESLPDYMSHLSRPKRSEVSVDTLIDEIGTDTHTFISALHENFALSCERNNPADPNSSLDYINGCLDYLSESDLLYPSWDVFFGGKGLGGGYMGKDSGSHILRQDEMAFQVAVRGLLFSLPSPEELEGMVELWATKILKGEDGGPGPPPSSAHPQGSARDGSSAFRKVGGNNVLPGIQAPASSAARQVGKEQGQTSPPPLLSLGNAARQELILERMPYMAHIARRRRCSFGTMKIRDLEKIVSFQGIGSLGAGEDEGDDAADEESSSTFVAAESWATDKPTEEGTPRKRRGLGAILNGKTSRGRTEAEEEPGLPMQSLVISDDDIEDD
ncbi:Rad17 cell cycle checkpoint protein-domain-containing protein [Corynascus similis CBS 632.67]